jgi:hypothetical protein
VSSARSLQFREGFLDAPNSLDVAILEFAMLWPNNETRRAQAMEAAVIHYLTETGGLPIPQSASETIEFARVLTASPRLGDFEGDAKTAFVSGTVAGKILLEAVGMSRIAPEYVNLSRIKVATAEVFREGLGIRMTEKTIDNRLWPTYRAVSSFWAAWLLTTPDPKNRFPCCPSDLGTLLATADALRRLGERTHTPQSPKATVLRRGESIMVPPTIALPAVSLEFERRRKAITSGP